MQKSNNMNQLKKNTVMLSAKWGDCVIQPSLICIFLYLGSALEFLSTCKLANLTVRAELGCCLLHRSGRLTIDGCILQCESHPLDHLSHAIVTTANNTPHLEVSPVVENSRDSVSVTRTRIEGGAKAVLTNGTLSLQQVRVIYTRTSLFFWFNVSHKPVPAQRWHTVEKWSKINCCTVDSCLRNHGGSVGGQWLYPHMQFTRSMLFYSCMFVLIN